MRHRLPATRGAGLLSRRGSRRGLCALRGGPGYSASLRGETLGWGAKGSVMPIGRLLILLGLVLVAVGLLWPLLTKLGLGRLPGDIVIERESFRLYIPLATSILISLVLSLLLWLFNR
jgi:hypothetical protein